MKKIYLLTSLSLLCLLSGCTENETIEEEQTIDARITASDEPCFSTTLVAGQHHEAGIVTVDIEDDNLVITFLSNGDWIIGTTHLSIGNCAEDWVPLTGSGNPKIGQFEYTEPFSIEPYKVVYIVSLEGLDDNYCFAAHAEVDGPTGGETAWAEGPQFDGNGWGMFVETTLSECDDDGTTTPY